MAHGKPSLRRGLRRFYVRPHVIACHNMPPITKEPKDREVSLRMPADLYDELQKLGDDAERNLSAEIRLALKDWVERKRRGRR